jgi:hypothetical protein
MQFRRDILRDPGIQIKYLLTAPLIYTLVIPLVLLDIGAELYHRICFPIYQIPYVKRRSHIRMMDRFHLPYLTLWEKIHCAYCGYANGLLSYLSAIAGETEGYWCGIMHKKYPNFSHRKGQGKLLPYGDETAFRTFVRPEKKSD